MQTQEKAFYSSKEAAKLLGVAVSTVQLWTNNGLLQAWVTTGGHRRITPESLQQLLKQQKPTSLQKPKATILIVEDDPKQLNLYQQYFNTWNLDADIETAKDGFEGLIKIGLNIPDIIVTDLMMPYMDGFELVKALSDIPELTHSLIIVASALPQSAVKLKGGLPSDIHYFEKPIAFNKLEDLVQKKIKSITHSKLTN